MKGTNLNIVQSIDNIINEYKLLIEQSKILDMRINQLKSYLTVHYFTSADTIYYKNGLVAATYKTYETTNFKTANFRLDHPALYDEYADRKEQRRLLIK